MARIDHAAEAAEWIADAPHALHGTSGEQQSTDRAVVCALLAQAQATLALVEQQRIANLIALAAQPEQFGPEPAAEARRALIQMVQDPEDGEYTHRARPTIAAALGIETAS